MPDKPISALPLAPALGAADEFAVVPGGVPPTSRCTLQDIADAVQYTGSTIDFQGVQSPLSDEDVLALPVNLVADNAEHTTGLGFVSVTLPACKLLLVSKLTAVAVAVSSGGAYNLSGRVTFDGSTVKALSWGAAFGMSAVAISDVFSFADTSLAILDVVAGVHEILGFYTYSTLFGPAMNVQLNPASAISYVAFPEGTDFSALAAIILRSTESGDFRSTMSGDLRAVE